MESNEPEGLLSHSFAWNEHIWDYAWPEQTGLPVLLFIDSNILDKTEPAIIMFCPYKYIDILKNVRSYGIPMVICDDPYIPEEYKNRKHELSEAELNRVKDWVVKYKDILLLTYDSEFCVERELEKAGAYK